MTLTAVLHTLLLTVSVLTTGLLAADAWHRRHEHGAQAFVALMCAFTVYSATHLVGLLTPAPLWRLVAENVQWVATATVPVFWLLFALEYTGYDESLERAVVPLAVIPLGTVLLTWTNAAHGLMWRANRIVVVEGLVLLDQTFGPWFWVHTTYTYVLVGIGAFLFLRLARLSDRLYADQAILLVVGVAVPVVASAMTVVELTPIRDPPLDVTPYAFAVSGLAFGSALFRYRLFDIVPATRQLGRAAAIRDLDDGLLIVDADRSVVYCNPAAATLLDCDPEDVLGDPVRSLLGGSTPDFDGDGPVELERDGRVYEVRTSPIHDRRDRLTGHTLVFGEVTDRVVRERRLARQRDDLTRLEQLNGVIRGVNRALVSARTREEIEEAVCHRLGDSDLYGAACVADLPSWNGDADRWTVAGVEQWPPVLPPDDETAAGIDPDASHARVTTVTDRSGTWTVVPLVYGRTVYGALGLRPRRPGKTARAGETARDGGQPVTERERAVLLELGELVGHAIDAVENRRLLAAESVVELEFRSDNGTGALAAAASRADCRFELTGFVPKGDGDHLAYLRTEGASPEQAAAAMETAADGAVRPVDGEGDCGLVEWVVEEETLVGTLAEQGANVLGATARDGTTEVVVEVASGANVRALVDRVCAAFPAARLVAKREHDRPVDPADGLPDRVDEALTDRQREALEAAYRAGYFDWPRESTAEEVAATLDIAASTLHAHLRKAEGSLLADLFDGERGGD